MSGLAAADHCQGNRRAKRPVSRLTSPRIHFPDTATFSLALQDVESRGCSDRDVAGVARLRSCAALPCVAGVARLRSCGPRVPHSGESRYSNPLRRDTCARPATFCMRMQCGALGSPSYHGSHLSAEPRSSLALPRRGRVAFRSLCWNVFLHSPFGGRAVSKFRFCRWFTNMNHSPSGRVGLSGPERGSRSEKSEVRRVKEDHPFQTSHFYLQISFSLPGRSAARPTLPQGGCCNFI